MGVQIGQSQGAQMVQLGGLSILPISDDFARADGAIGNGWNGATWTIATNKAINTPSLGAELIVNGTFAVDANWSKGTSWSISAGAAHHVNGSNSNLTQAVATIDNWYRIVWTLANRTAGTFFAFMGAALPTGRTGNNTFTETARQTLATTVGINSSATGAADIDDVSVKLITLADLFCSRDAGRANVDVSVAATVGSSNPCGVVANLDSAATPANFVIAYTTGTSGVVRMEKCVAGTYTQLVSASPSYVAGARVRLTKSGTTYTVYYNGTIVGTPQTVSDAGIISNTLHGIFSTNEQNSVDDVSILAG